MRSISQAWNLLIANKLTHLLFGVFAAALVLISLNIPGSTLWLSVSFVIIMEIALLLKSKRPLTDLKIEFRKDIVKKLILIFLLMPPGVLLGSALGFLQSPHSLLLSLSMTFSVLTITCYFVLVFSQSLMIDSKKLSFAKSLDLLFLTSLKKLNEVLGLCLSAAFLIMTAFYTKGIGLIVAIPLITFANIFCYKNVIEPLLQPAFPKPEVADSPAADAR